jgi:neutral ceramidase
MRAGMLRGTRCRPGLARVALLAMALACLGLVAAGPASAFRSKKGAKPTVKVLTKDQAAALSAKKVRLRVTVGTRSRVRLRVLAVGIANRPVYAVKERKIRFAAGSGRIVNLKLTKAARRGIAAAIAACRDVRITAFASGRQLTRRGDNPRTTLVRHSKVLKHRRKSGCAAGGTPGVPGSPGAPPGLGGPGLDPPGTPPRPRPPVPNDPITIRAGAADADATPPVGTPMFAYTARSQIFGPDPNHALQVIADPDENAYAKTFVPSQGIHTRIRARAIVIEAGGKKSALAMVDLGGHPYTFNQAVAARVEQLGIPHERLFLSSTHTHSSSGAIWSADNSGYAFVGGDAYDPRVFEMIASGVAEAITEANRRLQPARIGVGAATLKGASSNREHDAFKLNSADATPEEKASNREAVDHQVTAIRVDDANGRPLGVWSNFAIHPTSLGDENLLFSGDNVATAERLVEEEMLRDITAQGLPASPRPVNVWTNGTEGDVTENDDPERDPDLPADDPHSRLEHMTGGFSGANSSGRKMSRGIVEAWRDAGTRMSGSPAVDVRRTFMEFDGSEGSSPIPVLGAGGIVANEGSEPVPEGGCSPVPHPFPGQGNKMHLFGGPGVAPNVHPVSLMRIGPLAVAAYPTEIATVAGRRIRKAIAAVAGAEAPAGVIIAGLTNSYNSYLATPEEYDYCSYFGSFTLWGREQLALYRKVGDELARSVYGGAALPPRGAEPAAPSPGTPNQPSVRATPNAGDTVTEPAQAVKRFGLASWRFAGGDPAIDAPRGRSFVSLEFDRDGDSAGFVRVADEDSVMDTTQHHSDDSWTETWQFTECDATDGRYRFRARGRANTGGGEEDYEAVSRPFRLQPASIKSYSTTVGGGVARVRAEYEGLPASALATLARRVRHGFAVLRVTRPGGAVEDVIALPDSRGLEFRAGVPDGSSVSVVSIEDACGNTGR